MHRVLLSIVVCSFALFLDVDVAIAKKGGGGRSASRPNKVRPIAQPKHREGNVNRPSGAPFAQQGRLPRTTSNQRPTVPSVPQTAPPRRIDPRLGNEERKLEHRLQTAQHLRDNSARNGNPNLLNTADRMEQRAYQHYDSRLGRLSGSSLDPGLDDSVPPSLLPLDDVISPTQSPATPSALSGDRAANPVETIPRNEPLTFESAQALEERKLQHLFDVAQKLRDIAGRNGNENLLRTADKVEQVAISRYQAKLESWGNQASELLGSDVIPETPTIAARP